MIEEIRSNSSEISVSTNTSRSSVYSSYSHDSVHTPGTVRWDEQRQALVIYTGAVWEEVPGYQVEINMNWDAEKAIRWAKEKMQEEEELKRKLEDFPALKDAYEQYKIVEALVSNFEKEDKSESI